ncbi:MAG TPA: hypothetical protein PKH24_03830 [Sedimentisphaerales bacterium]|nr:hypothetical protein [Sedimentisphaerales bacterium]HNU28655.1 hypothetical protein [Sedimentisphaerales bacterium]
MSLCTAAPEPAMVQRAGQWTLDVRCERLQQLVLPWGPGGEQRFWYTIVTVTNRTGMDADFYPKCDLMTDTFQVLPAGKGVPPVVFDMIRQRHASRYPLLESLQRVPNRILEGEDNARDIAVIWKDFDPQATSLRLFIGGLSNETAIVSHPVAVDADGNPVPIYLRKTLEMDYTLRGDPALRSSVEVVYKGQSWVMR